MNSYCDIIKGWEGVSLADPCQKVESPVALFCSQFGRIKYIYENKEQIFPPYFGNLQPLMLHPRVLDATIIGAGLFAYIGSIESDSLMVSSCRVVSKLFEGVLKVMSVAVLFGLVQSGSTTFAAGVALATIYCLLCRLTTIISEKTQSRVESHIAWLQFLPTALAGSPVALSQMSIYFLISLGTGEWIQSKLAPEPTLKVNNSATCHTRTRL